MEPVDLVILDTVEHIGEVGLRIEAIQFGRFDNGHRAGQRFGTGVRPGKEPVLPADANRAQGALGGVFVD